MLLDGLNEILVVLHQLILMLLLLNLIQVHNALVHLFWVEASRSHVGCATWSVEEATLVNLYTILKIIVELVIGPNAFAQFLLVAVEQFWDQVIGVSKLSRSKIIKLGKRQVRLFAHDFFLKRLFKPDLEIFEGPIGTRFQFFNILICAKSYLVNAFVSFFNLISVLN